MSSFAKSAINQRYGARTPRNSQGIGCERWAGNTKSDSASDTKRDGDDHDGHDSKELPSDTGDKKHWRESDASREHREDYRLGDFPRPIDSGLESRLSISPVFVDCLAYDDRIIDHHTERQDEAEQRQHVDRYVGDRKKQERPRERHRDTERDPECQTRLKEKPENQQDKQQADQSVVEEKVDAFLVHL